MRGAEALQIVHADRDITPPPHNSKALCLGAQSCLTLGDLMDCGSPGSSVYGILQARILEWVAMPSSRGSS